MVLVHPDDVSADGTANHANKVFHLVRTLGSNVNSYLNFVVLTLPHTVFRGVLVLKTVVLYDDVGQRGVVRLVWRHLKAGAL